MFTIEPCPGAETGMSFVDSPTPVTPPTPTHLYFGQNGVFAVDMNRVATLYGVQDPSVARAELLPEWRETLHVRRVPAAPGSRRAASGGIR